MALIVCILGFVLGILCAVSPRRAISIWSPGLLDRVPLESRRRLFNAYRTFGILIAVVNAIFAFKAAS